METSAFCEALAGHFFTGKEKRELTKDFQWLVECGEENASFGYGPGILMKTNSTAIGLLNHIGEDVRAAILGCGAVGRAKCTGDSEYVQKCIKKTLNHYELLYEI